MDKHPFGFTADDIAARMSFNIGTAITAIFDGDLEKAKTYLRAERERVEIYPEVVNNVTPGEDFDARRLAAPFGFTLGNALLAIVEPTDLSASIDEALELLDLEDDLSGPAKKTAAKKTTAKRTATKKTAAPTAKTDDTDSDTKAESDDEPNESKDDAPAKKPAAKPAPKAEAPAEDKDEAPAAEAKPAKKAAAKKAAAKPAAKPVPAEDKDEAPAPAESAPAPANGVTEDDLAMTPPDDLAGYDDDEAAPAAAAPAVPTLDVPAEDYSPAPVSIASTATASGFDAEDAPVVPVYDGNLDF